MPACAQSAQTALAHAHPQRLCLAQDKTKDTAKRATKRQKVADEPPNPFRPDLPPLKVLPTSG